MIDLIKRPSFIAAIIILACYFVLPYYSIDFTRGKDDNEKTGKISFTGLALLTGGGSFSGEYFEDTEDKQKREILEGINEKREDCDTCKAQFGLVDKLPIILLLGSGLLLFSAFKASKGEKGLLDDQKIHWVKIAMLIIAGFLFTRYQFSISSSTLSGASWGMLLTLLATIFIMFETMIMSKVDEQMKKRIGNSEE